MVIQFVAAMTKALNYSLICFCFFVFLTLQWLMIVCSVDCTSFVLDDKHVPVNLRLVWLRVPWGRQDLKWFWRTNRNRGEKTNPLPPKENNNNNNRDRRYKSESCGKNRSGAKTLTSMGGKSVAGDPVCLARRATAYIRDRVTVARQRELWDSLRESL